VTIEDPVTTVVRLLQKNMHLVKDDGSLATVYVSKEWYDQALLKNYEAQVTVGLQHSDDKKLSLSGAMRRRLAFLKLNAWSSDRDIREKLREEINRIIREKRTMPNVTGYDFVGVGPPTGTHKAFQIGLGIEPAPGSVSWIELSAAEYQKLWYSDDDRYSKSHDVNGEYAMMLFRFKIESKLQTVKKIVLSFEGYGTAPAGNGVTIKVWDHVNEVWENAQVGTGGADETISITLTSDLTDYIDDDGYVWLLARTTNPSDGTTAAVLYSDYGLCSITVNGITYCDVVSFRDLDQVRFKPFLWRTEFMVKSWLFENVLGG
jgi:hypothetical protein